MCCSQDPNDRFYEEIADQIWAFSELGFQEFKSADLLCSVLQKQGFTVQRNLAGMNTCFSAEFGQGKPVIAVLGEYDALPGLSQKEDADHPEQDPARSCGHGCGHHLIGTGCLEAAVKIKQYLAEGHSGTIRYYGCPAEEGGGGKVYMLRAGLFEDVDVALSWHPGSAFATLNSSVAGVRATVTFEGKSSHAGAAPHLGRSALDAAELMNVGTNFLREHVTPDVRLHYSFLNAGSPQPNVIPAFVQMAYVVRANNFTTMQEVYARVEENAKGAAMMTQTTVSMRVKTCFASYMPNDVLENLFSDIQPQIIPSYTEQELAYADRFAGQNNLLRRKDLTKGAITGAGTDVADVSWNVPTLTVTTICDGLGSLHSWQFVAQGKSSLAHKGMHAAALAMDLVAQKLFEDPQLCAQAKQELLQRKGSAQYCSMLPKDARPGEA